MSEVLDTYFTNRLLWEITIERAVFRYQNARKFIYEHLQFKTFAGVTPPEPRLIGVGKMKGGKNRWGIKDDSKGKERERDRRHRRT